MLKYYLIAILNVPLVLYAESRIIIRYRQGILGPRKFVLYSLFWLTIFLGIVFVKPIENWLREEGLIAGPSLSVFDTFLTTGIILLLILMYRLYIKHDALQRDIVKLNRTIALTGVKPGNQAPKRRQSKLR